jgi:hypothetical protein
VDERRWPGAAFQPAISRDQVAARRAASELQGLSYKAILKASLPQLWMVRVLRMA